MRLLRRSAFLGRSSPKVVAAGTTRPGPGPACTRFCCARAGCIGAGRLIAPSRVPCSWGRQSSSCPRLIVFGTGASSPVLTLGGFRLNGSHVLGLPPARCMRACAFARACTYACLHRIAAGLPSAADSGGAPLCRLLTRSPVGRSPPVGRS